MGKLRFALQLYTVRDHLEKNVREALAGVSAAGYRHVEVAGTHGLSYPAFRKELSKAGLRPVSAHFGYEEITGSIPSVIEAANTLQVKYVVVPMIDPRFTPDRDGWVACAKALDAAGALLREAGLRLCYHNHAHEFQKLGGEYALDVLFANASPDNVGAELDTFWIKYAGLKPEAVITQFKARCPLLHVKDMLDAKSRAFAEMGRGCLDWTTIFAAAVAAGVQWYIVEQDHCGKDSLESARISASFMLES